MRGRAALVVVVRREQLKQEAVSERPAVEAEAQDKKQGTGENCD